MWRPGFSYKEKAPARVQGFLRRFWQASPDHRGTPGAPGRVVTLIPKSDATTDGIVYRIDLEIAKRVLAELDIREQGGYVQRQVIAVLPDGSAVNAMTYFAHHTNPHYLGPAADDVVLEQIQVSVGPSGTNADYLLDLASTLRQYGLVDEHVFALEAGLRKRLGNANNFSQEGE